MLKNPCYKCTNRNAECHGICAQYIEFERLNSDIRDKRYSEVELYKSDSRSNHIHKMQNKR